VIHGGEGVIPRAGMTAEREAGVRAALTEALKLGYSMLQDGRSSLDVVEQVIRVLEDSPYFNAGKGAVFTSAGKNELDASIMDGATRQAGAVAGVTVVKNPISAARAVMDETAHVMLAGPGADAFARSIGLETVEPEYFFTQFRWDALERARQQEAETEEHGTVGAVALDKQGHIAAGTSTGGMTNKKHGRIGDAPIIGAGTYADEDCGVSGTGWGEYYIRYAVTRDLCARMDYLGESITDAARQVIRTIAEAGGSGGVIALDGDGTVVMEFSRSGMYRGYIDEDGKPVTLIWKGD
jgi:beta-aspartyl-peptidase (threonine type)